MTDKVMAYKCDRCGRVEYARMTGIKEFDGGFTKVEVFETPKGWVRKSILGTVKDLCPDCSDLQKLIELRHKNEWVEFIDGGMRHECGPD